MVSPTARPEPVRLLFVCLGNICRSPTAEGVMQARIDEAGLAGRIEVDSAGTGGWHAGHPPDERAAAEAARRGIPLTSRARQVHAGDLSYYDLVLAMDSQNLADLHDLAPDAAARERVHLLRSFDPEAVLAGDLDVPDPYYGGPDGFAHVFDLVDAACLGVLAELRETGRA